MPIEETQQLGLFDRTVEDPQLELLLEKYLDAKDAVALHARVRRDIKKRVDEMTLGAGERVRCGSYVFTGAAHKGGGFEMPEWETVGIGSITVLDS